MIVDVNSQYVGARYVPKFYVNPDDGSTNWKAGVTYEALTIVTYNGDSYTSKNAVPDGVGNPADNKEYWVKTGDFNASLISLQERVNNAESAIEDLEASEESYAPIIDGQLIYTNNDHSTKVNYAKIDKQYKPRLVMAGAAIKSGNNWITGDVGKISAREKATIAINANGLYSSSTACGTVIVDGDVKYTCDIDYSEWGGHDLKNLYMKANGELDAIDAFASVSDILSHDPVWSFCGDNLVYYDGEIHHTLSEGSVSPHTVIAQDYTGNYLVMTTGGRRIDDYGMDYEDVVDCILHTLNFDAKIIYMADGGGSSSLVSHQIRLNRLLESNPRNVPTMLVFCKDDVETYSDFEAGYSQYLADIESKKVKTDVGVNGNVSVEYLGNSAQTFRESFYKGTQDISDDSWAYKEMFRLNYSETSHAITMLGRDTNDNLYTRMLLDFPNNSAQLLGREVLRGTEIVTASAEVTLTANGVFDASDIIGSTLPLDTIILSAYINSNGYVVLPANYNNKWVFAVKNISDMTSAGAITVTATITYMKSPVTFEHS